MVEPIAELAPAAADGALAAALRLALQASAAMLGVAILLITIRLLRGPSLPDRVIALDLIGTVAAGVVGLYAVIVEEPVYLFVAIVLALLLFVGTVAFGFHLEKGGER